jgi:hypothetical protein
MKTSCLLLLAVCLLIAPEVQAKHSKCSVQGNEICAGCSVSCPKPLYAYCR